jgi:hypothetical protein
MGIPNLAARKFAALTLSGLFLILLYVVDYTGFVAR